MPVPKNCVHDNWVYDNVVYLPPDLCVEPEIFVKIAKNKRPWNGNDAVQNAIHVCMVRAVQHQSYSSTIEIIHCRQVRSKIQRSKPPHEQSRYSE